MRTTGLIMAGGKGTRMDLDIEKPLLEICGRPMIFYVVDALRGSKDVDDIIVTTSEHTPETAETLKKHGIKVLETSGRGYVEDTQEAVKKLGLENVLVISADLPLITSDLVDEVFSRHKASGKPALTVALSESQIKNVGSKNGFTRLIPAGVNILDGKRINEEQLEEEVMIMDRVEVTLNVNTPEDLKLARSTMRSIQPFRRQ